jgi:uncharacterized alkaline shock family protein YloU/adenylate kinase family enzyme
MQVFALVGSSGTGKSHRATYLAFKYGINLIIDDGLLINDTSVLAGKSAKREATKIGAVKRAIFHDETHANEVKATIAKTGASKILILGTSEKMINRIAKRLDLPAPEEVIKIEDIASSRAIKKALDERKNFNSHVIPIPTFAIKKDFPGYLIDPLRSFWGKSHRDDNKKVVLERSIVRPIFNSLGGFYISEHALIQMTSHLTSQVTGVSRVCKVEVTSQPDGVYLTIDVNIFYGNNIPLVLQDVQRFTKRGLEFLCGLNLLAIKVTARRIELPESLNV